MVARKRRVTPKESDLPLYPDLLATHNHWNWERSEYFSGPCFGFIYRIVRKSDGKDYWGQKMFCGAQSSKWQHYVGSCKPLTADIGELGLEAFDFNICFAAPDIATLNMSELYAQVNADVLCRYLEGTCYNATTIGKTFFGTSKNTINQSQRVRQYLKEYNDASLHSNNP